MLPTVARRDGDGDGLAWNEPTPAQPAGALGHNQREALLGLISLAWCAGSAEAYERALAQAKESALLASLNENPIDVSLPGRTNPRIR